MQAQSEEADENDKAQALEALSAAEERINTRRELKAKNQEIIGNYPDESFFRGLDSSVKKNSAFIKKLKTFGDQPKEILLADLQALNLTKFIQEVVNAVAETKCKVNDITTLSTVCSLLHQRYPDFMPLLYKELKKAFEVLPSKDEEKAAAVAKYRVLLRLLGEFVLNGFIVHTDEAFQNLQQILTSMVASDKSSHVYGPAFYTLLRHCGEDLAGLIPRKHRVWAEKYGITYPKLEVVSEKGQAALRTLFLDYYHSMEKHLVRLHRDLLHREKQNKDTIGLRGELPSERKESYEKAQRLCEKLLSSVTMFADILDEPVPHLPEEQSDEREDGSVSINLVMPVRFTEYDADNGLWEDEDTKMFYENIKDLKMLIPQIVFKEVQEQRAPLRDAHRKLRPRIRSDSHLSDDLEDDLDDDSCDSYIEEEEEEPPSAASSPANALFDDFLVTLPNCVNRDLIDKAAEEFVVKYNNKRNRRKLVRALFTVNRIRLDLLPFYSRLVATLNPCFPDLGTDLVCTLKGDFRHHVKKHDQVNLESKIKTVRFLGELTKFRVCPKAEALHCLKILLDDFIHHSVDMAAALLDTCGRFLFRSPESKPKLQKLMDQMKRKTPLQNIDSRQLALIENALCQCDPPERPKVLQEVRSPIHEYFSRIIYRDLTRSNIEKILLQIRKFAWDDQEVRQFMISTLSAPWVMRYSTIQSVASVVSGLRRHQPEAVISIVDTVLEELRLALELNLPRFNQRRVSLIKYIGELYIFNVVEADVILKTLYTTLTFGINSDGSSSELDPPDNFLRIRLICTLLDTCCHYLDSKSFHMVEYFMVFFQQYYLRKKSSSFFDESSPFPKEVEFTFQDTLERVCPKIKVYNTLEEANTAVNEIIETCKKQLYENTSSRSTSTSFNETVMYSSGASSRPVLRRMENENDEEHSGPAGSDDQDDGEVDYSCVNSKDVFSVCDEVHLVQSKMEDPQDDTAFQAALDKIVAESLQARANDASRPVSVDVPIPMNLKDSGTGDTYEGMTQVKICTRKGCKVSFRELFVPSSSQLAGSIRSRQEAARAEKEEMKRLVLNYNQRQQEEALKEVNFSAQPYRSAAQHSRSSADGLTTVQIPGAGTSRGGSQHPQVRRVFGDKPGFNRYR